MLILPRHHFSLTPCSKCWKICTCNLVSLATKSTESKITQLVSWVTLLLKKINWNSLKNNARLASQIASFELGANISELCNQLPLKIKQMISWRNIDQLKAKGKQNLEYLAVFRKAQLARKRAKCQDWEKTIISKDTYNILWLLFCCFFVYCRYDISNSLYLGVLAISLL